MRKKANGVAISVDVKYYKFQLRSTEWKIYFEEAVYI